jgi:hypothetical protein
MTWTSIDFQPGIVKDDSPLKAQGYYIDADKVSLVAPTAPPWYLRFTPAPCSPEMCP